MYLGLERERGRNVNGAKAKQQPQNSLKEADFTGHHHHRHKRHGKQTVLEMVYIGLCELLKLQFNVCRHSGWPLSNTLVYRFLFWHNKQPKGAGHNERGGTGIRGSIGAPGFARRPRRICAQDDTEWICALHILWVVER